MKNDERSQYWIEGFRELFKSIEDSLPVVLDAAGCREGWIQGEAYKFFRNCGDAFYVNTETIKNPSDTGYQKADFASYESQEDDAPLLFIGELKVFGTHGYCTKNLTGGPLRPFIKRVQQGETITFLNTDEHWEMAQGGLLWDYFRIIKHKPSLDIPRILFLVIDTRSKKTDNFGRVIQSVNFERSAVVLHKSVDFISKCWVVNG